MCADVHEKCGLGILQQLAVWHVCAKFQVFFRGALFGYFLGKQKVTE